VENAILFHPVDSANPVENLLLSSLLVLDVARRGAALQCSRLRSPNKNSGRAISVDIWFFTKKLLSALFLPPTSLLLLSMLGLLLIRRRPRFGATLAWIGILSILVLSLPITASALMSITTTAPPLDYAAARGAQAVVVLGGGRRYAPEYGGETVSEWTLERVRYGAKVARELGLPILVTGGVVYGEGASEGELMAIALQTSFGISAKWIEGRSRDTHENAVFSAAMLRDAGIETIVLVTHDFHQRRSLAEFTAVGLRAIPAPVTLAPQARDRTVLEHLPNAGSLRLSALALHELLGYLVLAPEG
jgi:uncharacterized SAM-binding protein YcdF (DUF218 family)